MSLINEALKRADSAGRTGPRGRDALGGMRPAYGDAGRDSRAGRRGLPVASTVVLAGVVLVTVLALLWALSLQGVQLRRASLAEAATASDALPAGRGDAMIVQQPPVGAARPQAVEAQIALDKTLRAVGYYRPQPAAANVESPPAEKDPPVPADNRQPPPPAEVVWGGPSVAPAADGAAQAAAAQTGLARIASPAPPVPQAPAEPRNAYRLTGIVRDSNGPVAIINGFYVRAGQVVDEARVLEIGMHTVTLERGGVRITLKM